MTKKAKAEKQVWKRCACCETITIVPAHKSETAVCEKMTCVAQGFGMLTLDFLGEDLGCSFCENYPEAVKKGVCKKGRDAGFMECGIQRQESTPKLSMWQKLSIAAVKISREITFNMMVILVKLNAKTLIEKFTSLELVRFEAESGAAILWHKTPIGDMSFTTSDYAVKCSCEASLNEQKRFYKSVKSILENLEKRYGK